MSIVNGSLVGVRMVGFSVRYRTPPAGARLQYVAWLVGRPTILKTILNMVASVLEHFMKVQYHVYSSGDT